MTLTIPDELIRRTGLTEQEIRSELACRLFDAGKVRFHEAMRLANMDRVQFECALRQRGIAIYRPTVEDLLQDLETLDGMGV